MDRSAAYAARWVAKHVVASGAAQRCEIQVAYAIGVARPVSLLVETFGTADGRPGPDRAGHRRGLRPAPGGHHPGPRPAPAHLPQDGRLRALRPVRQGVQLGAAEPAGRLQLGAGAVVQQVKEGGRRRAGPAALPEPGALVARVVTDVAGVDKEFDYLVPAAPGADVRVGTQVRVDLAGRRVGRLGGRRRRRRRRPGLAAAAHGQGPGLGPGTGRGRPGRLGGLALGRPAPGAARDRVAAGRGAVACRPPALRRAAGPAAAGRAARRPAGRPAGHPAPAARRRRHPGRGRAGPAGPDPGGGAVRAPGRGAGRPAAPGRAATWPCCPTDWAQARAGAGRGRRGPGRRLGALPRAGRRWSSSTATTKRLVQEQAPTWNAVAVAAERARRAGVPCVVVSPCPTAGAAGRRVRSGCVDRAAERQGWAPLEVVDRRQRRSPAGPVLRAPGRRSSGPSRGWCACSTAPGGPACWPAPPAGSWPAASGAGRRWPRTPERSRRRPRLPALRPRSGPRCAPRAARPVLQAPARRGDPGPRGAGGAGRAAGRRGHGRHPADLPDADVLVGTEAVLHRLGPTDGFDAVAFVDFDQELLAPRVRAGRGGPGPAGPRLPAGRRPGRAGAGPDPPPRPSGRPGGRSSPTPACSPDEEEPLRRALRLPPVTAVALVSGPGAGAYVEGLRADRAARGPGPRPRTAGWSRPPTRPTLADALAAVPRPPGRLRVAWTRPGF